LEVAGIMLSFIKKKKPQPFSTVETLKEQLHALEGDLAEAQGRKAEYSAAAGVAEAEYNAVYPDLSRVVMSLGRRQAFLEQQRIEGGEKRRVLEAARMKSREASDVVRKLERSISELKTELGQAERRDARKSKKAELQGVDSEVSEATAKRESIEARLFELREKLSSEKQGLESAALELTATEANHEALERDCVLSNRALPKPGADLIKLRGAHSDLKKRIALLGKEIQSISTELDVAREAEKQAVLRRCELSRLNIEDSYGAAELVLQSAVDAFRDEVAGLVFDHEKTRAVAKKLGTDLRDPFVYGHDRGRISLPIQIGNTRVILSIEQSTTEASTLEPVAAIAAIN
jgi:chromosome segregation ATPase